MTKIILRKYIAASVLFPVHMHCSSKNCEHDRWDDVDDDLIFCWICETGLEEENPSFGRMNRVSQSSLLFSDTVALAYSLSFNDDNVK